MDTIRLVAAGLDPEVYLVKKLDRVVVSDLVGVPDFTGYGYVVGFETSQADGLDYYVISLTVTEYRGVLEPSDERVRVVVNGTPKEGGGFYSSVVLDRKPAG
jgi:hypothetical protein